MYTALEHTLEIVVSFCYSLEHRDKSVGRIPQCVLVNDCVPALADDLEVSTEKEP